MKALRILAADESLEDEAPAGPNPEDLGEPDEDHPDSDDD